MGSLTVPSSADVTMSAKGHIEHLCPYMDEVDHGTVTITWRVEGATFELHALRAYLNGFDNSQISHEELTDRLRHDLSLIDGVELLDVQTRWETARMEVQCSTSPTPAMSAS